MKRALPQIERVREHVGLAAEGELRGFACFDVLRLEALPRLATPTLLRQLKGEFQATVHAAARVHRFLDRDLMRCALEHKTARAGVKSLVVFAHDDKVNVLRPLVLQRAIGGAIKFHRTQIDVLLQLETEAQQDAFFEDAGLDLRMADGAEENRLELAQFVHRVVGQHLARLQITFTAEIEMVPVDFETEFLGRGLGHLEGFAGDFRPRAVAANDRNVVTFHEFCLHPKSFRGGKCKPNVFEPSRNGNVRNGLTTLTVQTLTEWGQILAP